MGEVIEKKRRGRKIGHKVGAKPPKPRDQVCCRVGAELLDLTEERAAELAFRTGIPVTTTDMVRMGLRLVLLQPLPPAPVRSPCLLADTAGGGVRCIECGVENPSVCQSTGLKPGATTRG